MNKPEQDIVIVLHGLAGSSWSSWLLARRLAASGFRVENWAYPSVRCSIPQLVETIHGRFARLIETTGVESLHVVAHSMGSIITRAVLAESPSLPVERFVMLAPPNHGSPVATRLASYLGWLSPAVPQLSDQDGSYVRSLPTQMSQDVGLILAAFDRVVPVESARLDAVRDVVTVPSHHGSLPFRRDVAEYCANFVKYGQFVASDVMEEVTEPVAAGAFAAAR